MSWFSNRFSASGKAFEGDRSDRERDDDHASHGKGVKEDFSELTKTFTRQLWGVASFLAPPPTAKSALQEEDPSLSPSSPADHHFQPNMPINSVLQSGEISLANELVDVDFQAPMDPTEHTQEEASNGPHISRQLQSTCGNDVPSSPSLTSDHGLTGIGKDLAELKGSVATGFSKILKAVREEIDRNELGKQQNAYDDLEEEDENDDADNDVSKSFVPGRRLPVFNSLFKPLLTGILHNDDTSKKGSTDDELDDEDERYFDDDPLDERGHQMSRPSEALNLQRTLGESLGGISKLASSLFPVNLDSDDEQNTAEMNPNFEAVGVTEEVLTFARNISMHPETWLDFPLFTDDDEDDDFELSDVQKAHVHAVEHAFPRLAALRIELCPDYMSEGRFWKIYFVLLYSRLSKKDAMLLSTPQIMEARALLLSNLQKESHQGSAPEGNVGQHGLEQKDSLTSAQSFKIVSLQSAMEVPAKDFDQVESPEANQGRAHTSGDILGDTSEEVQNKNVLASTVKLATLNYDEEEADADRWLHEESSPHLGSSTAGMGNEEDVSFSDLEDDDDSLTSKGIGSSNLKGTQGWVELNEDQEEQEFKPVGKGKLVDGEKKDLSSKMQNRRESNDWLTIDDDSDFA